MAGLPQDRACQESDTDIMACSRVNDERSLGLSGIKWVYLNFLFKCDYYYFLDNFAKWQLANGSFFDFTACFCTD